MDYICTVQVRTREEEEEENIFDFIEFVTYIHTYYSGNVVVVELIKDALFYRDFRVICHV